MPKFTEQQRSDSFASIEGSFSGSVDGDYSAPSPSGSQRSLSIGEESGNKEIKKKNINLFLKEDKADARLVKFLSELELQNYIEKFQKEEVSYKMLFEMDEKDLQDMGIPFGPRRAIAKAKQKHNPLESSVTSVDNIEIKGKIGNGNFGIRIFSS
jgi:hypothetical protein